MLKFELEIESANAEFATARDSLDALARITRKISEYSAILVAGDADPLAWTETVKDINGNRVGFFSFLWEGDEG
jgi:hypothetical protein